MEVVSVVATRTPIIRPSINLTSGISQNGVTTSIEIEESTETAGLPVDTARIVKIFVCPMSASSGIVTWMVAFAFSPISSDRCVGAIMMSQPDEFTACKFIVSGEVPVFSNSKEKITIDPGEACLNM